MIQRSIVAASCLFVFFVDHSPCAQSPDSTYWQDIRPVFRKHCTVCHSAKNLKEPEVSGGLALDSYDAVRKGSKQTVLEPGKSDKSLLVHLLTTSDAKKRMPLDAPPLSKENIALIRRWIDAGAKEGKRPDDEPEPIIAMRPATVRKRDVVFSTTATPPAGTLAKTTGKLELMLRVGPLAPAAAVAFSPDGKLLAVGSYGQVTLWDLDKAQPVKVLTNVLGAVNDVKFSPDGSLLAVGGGQPAGKGDLKLYQVADWKLLATLRGHDDVVFGVAFSRDGAQLASASFDKTVRVWKVADPSLLRTITDHSDFVYGVAFGRDGKTIVSASKDRTVKMVDLVTGKGLFTMGGMDQDVLAVAFHPEGKHLVSSGFESAIQWWNPRTGEKIKTQAGHGVAVHELAFSNDGKRLVSAGADRTVRVWDGATGAALRTINVGSVVYAVAISPSGKLVAAGSFDGLVRLYEEATGRHLLTLLALPAEKDVDWLAQTPEGYTTASNRLTGMARWTLGGRDAPGQDMWAALCRPDLIARAARGETLAAPQFGK